MEFPSNCLASSTHVFCRFLHASLQLNELCGCASVDEAVEILKAFPSKIEDVYLRTWDRILKQRARHALTSKAVLLWVLYATRPVTIDELELAVATCPITYKFEARRMMSRDALITICCGLVTIEDDSRLVRLVRESLHPFMCCHWSRSQLKQIILQKKHCKPSSLKASLILIPSSPRSA